MFTDPTFCLFLVGASSGSRVLLYAALWLFTRPFFSDFAEPEVAPGSVDTVGMAGGGGVKDVGFEIPPLVCFPSELAFALPPPLPIFAAALALAIPGAETAGPTAGLLLLTATPGPPVVGGVRLPDAGDFRPADDADLSLSVGCGGDAGHFASTPLDTAPSLPAGGATISSFPSGFFGVPLFVLLIFIFSPLSASDSLAGDSVTVWLPPPPTVMLPPGEFTCLLCCCFAAAEATGGLFDIASDSGGWGPTVAPAAAAAVVHEDAALSMSASRSMMRLPTSTAGQFSSSSNSASGSKFLLLLFLPTSTDLPAEPAVGEAPGAGLFLAAGTGGGGDGGGEGGDADAAGDGVSGAAAAAAAGGSGAGVVGKVDGVVAVAAVFVVVAAVRPVAAVAVGEVASAAGAVASCIGNGWGSRTATTSENKFVLHNFVDLPRLHKFLDSPLGLLLSSRRGHQRSMALL